MKSSRKIKVSHGKGIAVRTRVRDSSGSEGAFVAGLIRATPITPERVSLAKERAIRSRAAKSASFLDKYRVKAA